MQKYFKKVIVLKKVNDDILSERVIGSVILNYENGKIKISVDFLKNSYENLSFFVFGDNDDFYKFNPAPLQRFCFDFNGLTFDKTFVILGFCEDKWEFFGSNKNTLNEIKELSKLIKEQKLYSPVIYDDEIIATENYYKLDYETNNFFDKNANGNKQLQNEIEQKNNEKSLLENEANFGNIKEQNYYFKIKDNLSNLFKYHPKHQPLNNLIKNSNFVEIRYSDNNFYYVGIITSENQKEVLYICYAIFSSYNNPPKNFKEYKFIPISPFDLKGDGYFVIFQDAVLGEIIK